MTPARALALLILTMCTSLHPTCGAGQGLPLDSVSFARPGGLRGEFRDLFVFALDSDGGALSKALGVGGRGFAASSVESTRLLIEFIEDAVASNLSNVPFSSANGSFEVTFENGAPVVSVGSPGPIVAERARTLGRGTLLVGASYSSSRYTSIRGTPLEALQFDFAHANVQGEDCDLLAGADCSDHGFPTFENEVMRVDLDLSIRIQTLSFLFSYGALGWLDVTAAMPVVTAQLDGASQAEIIPFAGPPASNYFDGTADAPELLSQPQFVRAAANGVGDVALRVKARVAHSDAKRIGVLAEVRLPTGAAEDFLGSGEVGVRALGIASAGLGDFSPHLNAGYLYRGGALSDAVLGTVGFDHLLAPRAVLAMDLAVQYQVGLPSVALPDPVVLSTPYEREIQPTTIADRRDDIVDASVGFKFALQSGLVVVLNSTWPLNAGGVRPNSMMALGLEYAF